MKMNQKMKTILPLAAAMGSLASSANAATLAMFDAGGTGSNLQAGYTAISQGGSATDNGITLTNTYTNTATRAEGVNPLPALYRDFFYNPKTLTLSGLDFNTDYVLTIYHYDINGNSTTDWYIGADDGSPDHTSVSPGTFDESEAKFDLNVTSSGTGTVLITTGSSGFFNGMEVATVPEPTTTALLGLGGLALILRRRK